MPEIYGQFCPVAQAAEVVTERWTLLVLREMLMGSSRFNEIQRGVPRMSSSLLSKRLREMERSGLLTREPLPGERGYSYRLTAAGEALGPIVVQLGAWSKEWLQREISVEEADPALLMWDLRRSLRLDRLPAEQLVTFFRYRDAEEGKRAWWVVARCDGVDLCFTDPGFPVDLQVDAETQAMAAVWVGKLDLGTAMRSRQVKVSGPEHLVRSFPDWIGLSTFAYEDPAAEFGTRRG
ncbi:MAG: winged helix-turn-helix transcriptional regulator [Methanosarcina sp.]